MTFGMVPAGLASFLEARGFHLDEDVGAEEYRRRCYGTPSTAMRGYEFYRIRVCARTGALTPTTGSREPGPQRERGNPEHALGDDVALHLRRAGEDRSRRDSRGTSGQRRRHACGPALPAAARAAPSTCMTVSCRRWLISLQKSLMKRALRTERLPRRRRVSVRQLLRLRDLDLDDAARALAHERVARGRRVVTTRAPARIRSLEQHAVDHQLARRRAALVRERGLRDLPALVLASPTRCSRGTRTSSRKTSLNSSLPVICRSGRTVDARRAHVDDQVGDALRLRRGRIGAREQDAPAANCA